MLSLIRSSSAGSVNAALALIKGHHTFLKNNTGITIDPHIQHYALNPEGVLSNNRHFISDTMMEYQPNGDATTEGQALLIIGYAYSYLATKNPEYLAAAEHAWDAYHKYYYANQPIPDTPKRWVCNWLVNGKEPCLANWPVNPIDPTQGGYKCVPLRFVNGQAQIPHGPPFWGEYLDVLSFAHRGHMTWAAINGSVQKINNVIDWDQVFNYRRNTMPEKPWEPLAWVDWDAYLGVDQYSVNWSVDEVEYPASWINVWTGNKIGIGKAPNDQVWDGDIIETDIPLEDIGKVQMYSNNLNGVYFVNYAVRLPVDKGGYMFKRNEVWHNRPVHAPLLGSVNQMGNASDAEQWFADACLLLADITGKDKYRKAMYACLATCYEYTNIDGYDKFFRQSKTANTPFTDGISYDFYYPSDTVVKYGRDAEGFITMDVNKGAQVSLEQQSIWFRATQDSLISTDYGGIGITGKPVSVEIQMVLNKEKNETDETKWSITLPLSVSSIPRARNFKIGSLTRQSAAVIGDYIMASAGAVGSYGTITVSTNTGVDIVDGRTGPVIDIHFADDDGGAWITVKPPTLIRSIVYKANADMNIRIVDDNGWLWWWMLEDTQNVWVDHALNREDLRRSYYQPNHPDDEPRPDAPVYEKHSELSVLLDDSSSTDVTFSYYSMNGMPTGGEGYIPADLRAVTSYGPVGIYQSYSNDIVDGRSGSTVETVIYTSQGDVIIGNWLQPGGVAELRSIVYKSTGETNIRITDRDNWRWYWLLPNTNNVWTQIYLPASALNLNYYQPDHPDTDPRPTAPNYGALEDFTVVLENSGDTGVSWAYYCLNEMPERFLLDDAYTMKYRVTLSCDEPFTATLGDCVALNVRDDALAYTPGLIPFSNIYAEGTDQISAWHGMPYPGYQYPLIYCLNLGNGKYDRHLANMIQFMYDAQKAYKDQIGELGPVASAYVWNRWDNFKYGTPDTFTMYHWGDGKAWSGYQPRAFQAGCRLWQEMVAREQVVPQILKDYCENWITWLAAYARKYNGQTPTDFPTKTPAVPLDNDFTGHMCGLWLAGAVHAAMAGSKHKDLDYMMEVCVRELRANYVVTGIPGKAMDGAWSPAVREGNDNGMYFGFWGGEIMRGLGLYAIYKRHGPRASLRNL